MKTLEQLGWWKEECSSESLTDCTLNHSLLDIHRSMESTSSPLAPDTDTFDYVGASTHSKGRHKPSRFTFSSFSKVLNSPLARDSISTCCVTATETVTSSNWSQVDGGGGSSYRNNRTFSDVVKNCMACFWPTKHSLEERHHNDCFVAFDDTTRSAESNDWQKSYPDTPVYGEESDEVLGCIEPMDEQPLEVEERASILSPLTTKILSLPSLPLSTERQKKDETEDVKMKLARLTPLTINSKASFTEYTKNGATITSTTNTMHRRTDDISLGFFTAQTLDAIYCSPTNMDDLAGTPRNQDGQLNTSVNHRSAFQTPGNRARIDSDSFRRTMKVVTCEKGKISDDSEVSPIDSDAGFSPIKDSRMKRMDTMENLPPRNQPQMNKGSHQRQLFGVGSVMRHGTPGVNAPRGTPSNVGRALFQDFVSEGENLSPLSEFGMNVMRSIQTMVQRKQATPAPAPGYDADKENAPGNTPACALPRVISHPDANTEQPWQGTFLQKSSSFLKALRRSDRRGKVLVQGWVAFRETDVSWKEIIRSPERCDFRYLILLNDMPLLHIFSSRLKQKKLAPKSDLFQNCMSLDLSRDVAMEVELASKEFGNEICIVNTTIGRRLCSLLPIPMPPCAFLDKHKSRLAKGGPLKKVFEPFKRTVTFAGTHDMFKPPEQAAIMEQYDVARHLLFVLDCAIKFPLGQGCERKSLLDLDPGPAPF